MRFLSYALGISEAGFFRLLKKRVFVDYFNVFLTLPVFSQRVIYRSATDEFEFDPPVKSAFQKVRVDKTQTLNWLYQSRFPLFLKTDLYLEYKLCRRLLQQPGKSSPSSIHRLLFGYDNYDHQISDAIGHVTGMRQFRKYLEGGPGTRLLRLWMDVERFFDVPPSDQVARWMAYREIQVTFYDFDCCPRASGDWTAPDSSCIIIDGQGFVEVASFCTAYKPTMSKREADQFLSSAYFPNPTSHANPVVEVPQVNLKTLQNFLLQILRKYWLSKWLLHRHTLEWLQASNAKEKRRETSTRKGDGKTEGRGQIPTEKVITGMTEKVDKMSKTCPVKGDTGSKERAPVAECCVVEEIFLASGDANEIIAVGADRNVALNTNNPGVSSKVHVTPSDQQTIDDTSQPSKEIERKETKSDVCVVSSGVESVPSAAIRRRTGSALLPSSLPSDTSLTDILRTGRAAAKSSTLSGRQEQKKDNDAVTRMRRRVMELRKSSLSCKELSSLAVRQQTLSGFTCQPCPGMLCRQPSKPCLASEPEISSAPGYRHEQRVYLRGVIADRLAGGPFEIFLGGQGCEEGRAILNFWKDAQVYLSCKGLGDTSVQAYFRCRRAKALIMRYLTGNADRRICILQPALRYSLQRHLAIGKGDELIRRAQDVAIEYLRPMWQLFMKSDSIQFENSVVATSHEASDCSLKSHSKQMAPTNSKEQVRLSYDSEDRRSEDRRILAIRERARLYEAKRRTELALQFAIDVSHFCLDGLLVDSYPESEITKFSDAEYGSLVVKKLKIVHRPDILRELRMRRFLDQLAVERKRRLEKEGHLTDIHSVRSASRTSMKDGKLIKEPGRLRLRSCEAIFDDPVQLEYFRQFLTTKNAATPLIFYLEVEKLKKSQDPEKQNLLVRSIVQRFFKEIDDVKSLESDSRVLEIIHHLPNHTTREMLLTAQAAVFRCLIDRWCDKYIHAFDELTGRKKSIYEHWMKFLKDVINLRSALLDVETFQSFEEFAASEVAYGNAVNLEGKMEEMKTVKKETQQVDRKSVNDLRIMRDMESYRLLCDRARRMEQKQQLKPEDLKIVSSEAKRIISTYITKDTGPTVNISAEVAESLKQPVDENVIGRDRFHYATIEIYPLVDQMWQRYSTKARRSLIDKEDKKPGRLKKPRRLLTDEENEEPGRLLTDKKDKKPGRRFTEKEDKKPGRLLTEKEDKKPAELSLSVEEDKERGRRLADEVEEKRPENRTESEQDHTQLETRLGDTRIVQRASSRRTTKEGKRTSSMSQASSNSEAKRMSKARDSFNIRQKLNFDDDRMHVVFSILNGLRFFMPRSTKHDPTTVRQLIPGVYQLFYELPSVQTVKGRQPPDGLYDQLQLKRRNILLESSRDTFQYFVVNDTLYVLLDSFEHGSKQKRKETNSSTTLPLII